MEEFWGNFLRYRFDFAALAYDCVAAFFRNDRPFGRVMALAGAFFMVLPPIFVLMVGSEQFGDAWAFGLTLVLFVVLLEAPGHLWRHGVANGGNGQDDGSFDRFLFAVLTLLADVLAPFLLIKVHIESTVVLGIAWGVALVGAQDIARSGIACGLALARGRPVYKY
jgi:hypothetical protein